MKKLQELIRFSALCITVSILCLLVIESVLDFVHYDRAKWLSNKLEPYYRWSFVTSDERPIGQESGPLRLMFDPKVGYLNLPNQKHACFNIDEHGFREVNHPDPKSTFRIIVIGGSTAFGTGLKSDNDAFPNQLQDILRSESVDAEVINAAVIGHRSGQELSNLIHNLVDLDPDLIVALNGFNDYSVILRNHYDPFNDFNGGHQTEDQLRKLYVLSEDNVFRRLSNIHRIVFKRTLERIDVTLDNLNPKEASDYQENLNSNGSKDKMKGIIETYCSNMVKMNKICSAFSSRLLVVTQPVRDTLFSNRTGNLRYTVFCDSVCKRLEENEIHVVNSSQSVDLAVADIYNDIIHLNRNGNAILARLVAEEIIIRMSILENGQPKTID